MYYAWLSTSLTIELHGITCAVCEFNFEEYYGEHGRDFIEIHYLKPLSTLDKAIEIDPQLDLVPVCHNCHRLLHQRKGNVLSVSELKDIIKTQHN